MHLRSFFSQLFDFSTVNRQEKKSSFERKHEIICFMFRSSHQMCSIEIGVLKNFTKFTGKHLCQSLFLNKVAGLRPATLLKKRLWHRCFPVNFAKFLRTPFLQNTSGRLLLYVSQYFFSIRTLWEREVHPRRFKKSSAGLQNLMFRKCYFQTGKITNPCNHHGHLHPAITSTARYRLGLSLIINVTWSCEAKKTK